MKRYHRMSRGAEIIGESVRFRLWAPGADAVSVALDQGSVLPMQAVGAGWYECVTPVAGAGSRYRYEIAGQRYPDPASRHQPDDPLGASEVIDPNAYEWQDEYWKTPPWQTAVFYELHLGSFTPGGTCDSAIERLDHLVELGVTAVELMPVAECPGRWNWGYDGVLLYAPTRRYGGPDALKRLVDACHARGLAVVLDVVYNHFGPEGNFLHAYAPQFFTGHHQTPWGAAINFDDEGSRHVRDFFIDNALYWLQEFHFDGLRFDAVHAIVDDSTPDIVVELGRHIRDRLAPREPWLILENDHNRASVLGAGIGGPGPHTAQWNDDFHHVLRVLTTDAEGGYYRDYLDHRAERLGRVLAEGFDYQGETSLHRGGALRGEPSVALPPTAFVSFIQNHDQVGNHAYGWRLPRFASEDAIRCASAILLLSPQIPMLWMGQEWACEQPFPFFCDFEGELAEAVRQGRLREFSSFPEFQDAAARARIPDPLAASTFDSAVLDWDALAVPRHRHWLALHRTLLRLRRVHLVPLLARAQGEAATRELAAPGYVDLSWRFGGGEVWRLRANVSQHPFDAAAGPMPGTMVFETHAAPAQTLPPWYLRASVTLP